MLTNRSLRVIESFMSNTYTNYLMLAKPGRNERDWDIPINTNFDSLDALSSVSGLVVAPTESPSATLRVKVAPGKFLTMDSEFSTFAGQTELPLPANSSTAIWLSGTSTLGVGIDFPNEPHIALATVATSSSSIISISDARAVCHMAIKPNSALIVTTIPPGSALIGSSFTSVPVIQVSPGAIGFFGKSPTNQLASLVPLNLPAAVGQSDNLLDVTSTFSQSLLNTNFSIVAQKINSLVYGLQMLGLMAP